MSFETPERTWLIDITFLASRWQCIWDTGCPGVHDVPTPELAHGCCSYGAHFADTADRDRVRSVATALTPEQWQHRRSVDEAIVADSDEADTWTTAVVDGACVFLNRRGFAGGRGCALHRGALETQTSVIEAKPEVCWQLPLRLEHHEDENGHLVSTLRQWRGRDWGEAGADFAWWCTEHPLAFVGSDTVADRLADEIIALVGPEIHARIVRHLTRRAGATPVPHPALGRRS